LIDPSSFDDVSSTILSGGLADLAVSLVSRGDAMETVSEFYNKAMLRDKAERMSDWWYYTGAHRKQLEALVGDDAWPSLATEQRAELIEERALYIKDVRGTPPEDITAAVYSDSTLGDAEAVKLALTLMADKNRVIHRRYFDSISDGANVVAASFDWTKLSADHLGEGESEKWLLTVVDEKNRLLGAFFTTDTALRSAKPLLLQLKANGIKPKVVILDNLPSTEEIETGMAKMLKQEVWPGSLKAVIQDRFHVVQNFCKDLTRKQDPDYHVDIIQGIRRSTRRMNPECLEMVLSKLRAGKISKSVFLCGEWYTTRYTKMGEDEIKSWLDLGVIDAMFCSGTNPVIPYESLSADAVKTNIEKWNAEVIVPKYFDRSGNQIRVGASYRLGNNNLEKWNKKARLLILRVVKCILPQTTGLSDWKFTHRVDTMTQMKVVQQLFNSSSNESWHSRLEDIGGHGTATRELKHAQGTFGLVRLLRRKEDDLREKGESVGGPVGYDRFGVSILANQYAEAAGSHARLPVPQLGKQGKVTSAKPTFLREMEGPLVAGGVSGTRKRVRATVQHPLDKDPIKHDMPTGRFFLKLPAEHVGPRTYPTRRSRGMAAFFAPAEEMPSSKRSRAESPAERAPAVQGGGAAAVVDEKKRVQNVRNRYTKWNRYPCSCKPKGSTRSTPCARACARQTRAEEMIKSKCAEANDKSRQPAPPGFGETVEYLPSAKPSTGYLVALAPTTSGNAWLEVGERCQTSGCQGFGLLSGESDHSKAHHFKANINTVQLKVGKSKRWKKTALKDIFLCKCEPPQHASMGCAAVARHATSLPDLPTNIPCTF
jgi:hypothetical protein